MIDLDALAADGFGYWFSGFVDGEGSFCIGRDGGCDLIIALRADDQPILEEIRRRLGVGTIHRPGLWSSHPNRNPAARWVVRAKGECADLVEVFRRFPLRSKKARDFETWAIAVELRRECRRGVRQTPENAARAKALYDKLRSERHFTDVISAGVGA